MAGKQRRLRAEKQPRAVERCPQTQPSARVSGSSQGSSGPGLSKMPF